MNKFSKAQRVEKAKHHAAVSEAFAKLEEAIEKFNDTMSREYEEVEEARVAYAQAIADANEWREGLASDARTYYDERSETWQADDKGQQYDSWIDVLDTEFEDPTEELAQPDALEVPEDISEAIDQLQESADEV